MGKFAKASSQAASVMKALQGKGNVLASVGTVRDYESSLRVAAQWAKDNQIPGGLRGMSVDDCNTFLKERGEVVGQKTVDQNRLALQTMLTHVTGKLAENERLPMAHGIEQKLEPRAYTAEQVALIAAEQTPRNALATEIAYAAGLRASELLTLRPIEERAPDVRTRDGVDRRLDTKFAGREGELFTVHGKGGLIREVMIPSDLAQRLEACRFAEPQLVVDRGVNRQSLYDIGGGNAWSASVTRASQKIFGWSTGAHGLRHAYAQERMDELRKTGLSTAEAKETVSQEVGHFRSEITEVYLR